MRAAIFAVGPCLIRNGPGMASLWPRPDDLIGAPSETLPQIATHPARNLRLNRDLTAPSGCETYWEDLCRWASHHVVC
ncbi:hypothetical protein SUNI508_09670 [Seiridium unicorne]|uniref:Uncharacterized protein n=1 Tax=Seiridium unicorne TaxID=138068 RepID=A0ABR2UQE0_9PEZI